MVFIPPKDRVLELSTSNSQTVFSVAGSGVDTSYNAFSAHMSIGDITIGAVVEPGVAFKSGWLTYSATNEITIDSTGFESKGTFSSSGTKEVFMGLPAHSAVLVDGPQSFTSIQKAQGRNNLGIADGSGLYNLSLAVSAGSSALTIALKDSAGNDPSSTSPAVIDFRSATLTSGVPTHLAVTAATSLVIPSGATMNVPSSTAFRLWVVGFNDAGTFRLGVINCSDIARIYPLNEASLASSTALSSSSNNGGMFYTGTAVSSKAFRILGYLEWSPSGLTAGTWTVTNLIEVQLFGPGIKKPGDVVQMRSGMSGAATTISSTVTASNITDVITPTSAANLIRLIAFLNADSGATKGNTRAQWQRGTAPGIGSIDLVTQDYAVGLKCFAIDKPNTTSSQAYTVYGSINTGTSSFNSNNGIWQFEEIMG